MKTMFRTLSMIAICLMASMQFCSCSSSDDEIPEQPKNFDVSGKWMSIVAQSLEKNLSMEEAAEFAGSFPTPYIELIQVGKSGTVTWFEMDPETNEPIRVAHHGTFSIDGDQITVKAPGSKWMNGTHTIESVEVINGQPTMQWIVQTSKGKGRFFFSNTYYNDLAENK